MLIDDSMKCQTELRIEGLQMLQSRSFFDGTGQVLNEAAPISMATSLTSNIGRTTPEAAVSAWKSTVRPLVKQLETSLGRSSTGEASLGQQILAVLNRVEQMVDLNGPLNSSGVLSAYSELRRGAALMLSSSSAPVAQAGGLLSDVVDQVQKYPENKPQAFWGIILAFGLLAVGLWFVLGGAKNPVTDENGPGAIFGFVLMTIGSWIFVKRP